MTKQTTSWKGNKIKDWEREFNKKFLFPVISKRGLKRFINKWWVTPNPSRVKKFIHKVLEEAYQRGVQEGLEGKVFDTVTITEKLKIPEVIIKEIKQEAYFQGKKDAWDELNKIIIKSLKDSKADEGFIY